LCKLKFYLCKLRFSVVTPLVLLCKKNIKKITKIIGFQIVLFGSRIDLGLVSTKSRVIITFWTIGPPLFSSSGNQSFRYTVRFTSTLSFECYCVHPISPMPYRSPVLQPFRAIAFAYFSFGVRSVEFVSWSRSCCWLENVRVQFMCFFHHFNQFVGTAAIFSHFRTVLSSNSESVHKTTRTFAYGL